MTLLTVDDIRDFDAAAGVSDEALQLLLDAAEAEITRVAGPLGSAEELIDGGLPRLVLRRSAASVTTVTEAPLGATPLELETDDWELSPAGSYLIRLSTGTNARSTWRLTRVSYVPVDDTAIRKAVQRDLVLLDLTYNPGVTSETVGAWSVTHGQGASSAADERAAILSRLGPDGKMAVV